MKKLFRRNQGKDCLGKKMAALLKNKRGSGYVDQAVVILIAVVLGALLLAG